MTLDDHLPNDQYTTDFATAWDCADDCDTCWYYITDTALQELGDEGIAPRLRAHLESGHTT